MEEVQTISGITPKTKADYGYGWVMGGSAYPA